MLPSSAGFYGTVDVHMHLEEKIAKFMGYPEACLYSSGFATLASVIPAFSKPTDFLIIDKAVTLSAQVGATISRSRVSWFNHNDMNDLKRVLETLKADNVFDGTKRVFCVIEGIYMNIGGTL
jgi:serine palmitoyltransferase